jgi:predicted RNase H-like HicB family nuclease
MGRHLTFDVLPDEDGGYHARCRQADIFTQGETLDEVRKNVLEAVQGHFYDQPDDYFVTFQVAEERVRIPA